MVVISSRLETKMKSELEDWPIKIVQTEAIKEKKLAGKKRSSSLTSGVISRGLT